MWNAVRKVKVETSLDIECGQDGLYLGKTSDDDYSEDPRESQVQALEYELGIESSWEKFENMTDEDLQTAAEMFMFLNACPANDATDMKQSVNAWSQFYNDLFQTQSAKNIILTLNRLIKNKEARVTAEKLFKRMTSLFELKYPEFQTMLPAAVAGLDYNQTFNNDSVNMKDKCQFL